MKTHFTMENDVGIEVEYTVLAVLTNNGKDYVIYTNHLPADNKLGKRILVGELICVEPLDIKRLFRSEEKEIKELFISEVLASGKIIKDKVKE